MELPDIQTFLKDTLKSQIPPLRIRHEEEMKFEVCGTKERMQGKQKVDGYYFASIIPKPKDVRLYFFPIYTHADQFEDISLPLRKCLKGKSCFHIKKMDEHLQVEIQNMVQKGVNLYLADDLI